MLMVDEERELVRGLIQKALDAGWQPRDWHSAEPEIIRGFDVYKYGTKKVTFWNDDAINFKVHLLDIIFDHRFARYIWGEKKLPGAQLYFWQLNLQQMVLANDRLEYLSNNT